MNIIESKLTDQINYLTQVSTGQPHEGSGYASAKVLQMAWHRIQHARSRVRELDDSKNKYMQATARQQRQAAAITPAATAPTPSPSQPALQNAPAVTSAAPDTNSTSTSSVPTTSS